MLFFLDTEYTGLGQAHPKLISLVLVAEDGSREFHVELTNTWTLDDCTSFVQRNVLPHLSGRPPHLGRRWWDNVPFAVARLRLSQWIAFAPRIVKVACDSSSSICWA
jgi:hypothetical protein